ncbi:MAG: serine/threonine protein kinase [Proteobacteria bacterium]|nr:serine/threonine protein kinase [Pseudomonadota bacterium]
MCNTAPNKTNPSDAAMHAREPDALSEGPVTSAPEAPYTAHEPKLQTPKTLADKYSMIRELGSGAQAKVFLAKRLSDGKLTAIKQLRIDSIKNWKEYTLFHREAEVLSTLDIPGVVKLYDAYDSLEEEPPCSYIIQEYIDGPTLKQVLKSGYRFSVSQVYDLVLQIIGILENLHAHEPPVIHRDIKPSNIILRNWDRDQFDACLIDFGAVSNAQVQSGGSTIAGTFGYMAPEQNIGRATPASDTYALAALTAYLLSGVEPADMKTGDLRLIVDPHIENHPRPVVQTLRQMLEPNMANRLSDLSELRRRFTAFKEGRYERIQTDDGVLAATDFQARLTQVKHLCQPQNIDIWQALPNDPDQRPALPDDIFYTHPRFHNYLSVSELNDKHTIAGMFISMGICGFIGIQILIMAFISELFWRLFAVLLIFAIIFLGTFLVNLSMKLILKKFLCKHHNFSAILDSNTVKPEACSAHQKLYQHGQKTIATITEISHIPLESTINSADVTMPRFEAPPIYRIWYKFNPPDDAYFDDLVHYIDIHNNPTGKFKVGDPLPILYRAAGDDPCIITDSMPFPLPFVDMEHSTDYIYQAIRDQVTEQADANIGQTDDIPNVS